jgi:hypothetical protein
MRLFGLGIPGALDTIAGTIQQVEGYYPGSLAYVNNNPGNLVYTSYYASAFGAIPGAGGFAKFPDYATGYAALQHQIQVDAARGDSISDLTYSWLGSGQGGNAPAYAASIANALGVDPSTSVQSLITDSGSSPLPIDSSVSPPSDISSNPGAMMALGVATLVGILILSR